MEPAGAFRQALATVRHFADEPVVTPGAVLAATDGSELGLEDFVPLETDFDRQTQQKNWMPFVNADRFYAVYQLVPMMKVLAVDAELGSASLVHTTPPDAALSALQNADVRGGSQCVHVPKERLYLGVAHVSRGRMKYTHFFFAFADEPPFAMLGVSREWCLAHRERFDAGMEAVCEGVQFVSGLALVGKARVAKGQAPSAEPEQTLALTYGVMDCDARVAHVSLQSALRAIRFAQRDRVGHGTSKSEEL